MCNTFPSAPRRAGTQAQSAAPALPRGRALMTQNLFAASKTKPLPPGKAPRVPQAALSALSPPSTELQARSLSSRSQEIKSISMFQLQHFTAVTSACLSVPLEPTETQQEGKRNEILDKMRQNYNLKFRRGSQGALTLILWLKTATGLFTSTP